VRAAPGSSRRWYVTASTAFDRAVLRLFLRQMIVEAPVCWPTAKLLDLLLGSHTTHYYRREELGALVDLHATSGAMSQVESELVGGVLRLQGQRVEECMRKDVYTVGDMVRVCDVDLKKVGVF
jgi:CBS domain containing-hemolysin-like protein